MDMEFDKVTVEMPDIMINTSAAKEHVAEVEHCIRIIKEWARATASVLPFTALLNIMAINLIHVFWLKMNSIKFCYTDKFSPRELIC